MSLRIEIKEDREKIAKEIEEEIRKKYGEKIGEISFYPTGLLDIAKLGLSFVQIILSFLNENDPEYPFFKGLEAGLKEYLKYSEKRR